MSKRALSNIAASSGGHCVERAISTMRLALGYEDGLPSGWPVDITKNQAVLSQLCSLAFPQHTVKVWHGMKREYEVGENVIDMGSDIPAEDQFPWDEYLTAFAYKVTQESAHLVIGDVGGSLEVMFTLAVEIAGRKIEGATFV